MRERDINVHFQHIGDAFVFVFYGKRLAVVAMSLTDFAFHPNIGEQAHVHLFRAVAVARFTPTAGDVETKPSGFVAAQFRFR